MKTALINGTKSNSTGRYIAEYLHSIGWEIWLYSRKSMKIDKERWHERSCDVLIPAQIKNLLKEINSLSLVLMFADSGNGYGELQNISEQNATEFINVKLTGSLLFLQGIMEKGYKNKIKIGWSAGKLSAKPKHLILYSLVNPGIAGFVKEINLNYNDQFSAYYIPTPVIGTSPLGELYISLEPYVKDYSQSPEFMVNIIKKIISNDISPGIIETETILM